MPNYLTKEEIRQWRSSLEKITLEEFEEFFNKVMKEDYIITYYDQAYTPFVKPEIYIL